MTLTDTLRTVRSIPRAARVVQGFPRIRDFAMRVMRVRAERAKLAVVRSDPVRSAIRQRLQRILDDQRALRRAARETAGLNNYDSAPCKVVYRPRSQDSNAERFAPAERGSSYVKYRWHNCGASGIVYRPSTRYVSVPAAWLIVRIHKAA